MAKMATMSIRGKNNNKKSSSKPNGRWMFKPSSITEFVQMVTPSGLLCSNLFQINIMICNDLFVCLIVCLFVLRFYIPVKVMASRSVNLSTLDWLPG